MQMGRLQNKSNIRRTGETAAFQTYTAVSYTHLISQEELDRAFDARFPKEMQVKLRSAKVAIAGLGGLGSNIAVMLARSGIGKDVYKRQFYICGM